MTKKRKGTPQTYTLLDFFGKGEASGRDAKKARVNAKAVETPQRPIKREIQQDIIVIDTSDDDVDVIEVSAVRSTARSVQTKRDVQPHSAPGNTLQSEVQHPTTISVDIKDRNVKSEPDLERHRLGLPSGLPSMASAMTTQVERQISPFGFPSILVAQGDSNKVISLPIGLSEPLDCSHPSHCVGDISPNLKIEDVREVDEVLGVGDWDMGDDKIEPFDVDTDLKFYDTHPVDFDLTLEDDEDTAGHEQLVQRCPICERMLSGMNTMDIDTHVDKCLNASNCSRPNPSGFVRSAASTLRPSTALDAPQCARFGLAGPSNTVKQERTGRNAFFTLMSSHKENAAWKEASVVEDSNFRAFKANGGRRKAPFYKVMQGMPIAVDAFRYGTIPNVTAYFLTHAHSDHYTNLSAKWNSGPIYCSQGTANLVIHMLGVDAKWIHPLPMDVATTIPNTGGVKVTLIEANHCPGSCLFLFEGKQTVNAGDSAYKSQYVGSSTIFRYLHCGDFRACPQHVLHGAIKGKRIDYVYLDTTYLDPKYCFPPQPLVISACAELAKRLVRGDFLEDTTVKDATPRKMTGWFTRIDKDDKGKEKAAAPHKILVVVGTYSIGKERIVKAVAKALDTKVYCDARKAAILRCQSDPELHALLTTEPLSAGVHLVPLAVIATDRLKAYMERWKGHWTKVIGFRPTGWTYTPPSGTDMLPSIPTVISRSQSRTFTHANLQPMRNSSSTMQVYGVPYSEHSSFFELTCFALSLDWVRMIATVNVGSEASRGKMAKWVERWEAERKKREQGATDVVSYRAEDYW